MAYIKKQITTPYMPNPNNGYPTSTEPYKPFSYYVLGGTDIGGDSLLMNGDAMFDTDEEINQGFAVDATCNPRIGFFQIAESAGIEQANLAKEQSPDNTTQNQTE